MTGRELAAGAGEARPHSRIDAIEAVLQPYGLFGVSRKIIAADPATQTIRELEAENRVLREAAQRVLNASTTLDSPYSDEIKAKLELIDAEEALRQALDAAGAP